MTAKKAPIKATAATDVQGSTHLVSELTRKRPRKAVNREQWLANAVEELRPLFGQLAAVDLPAQIKVSVGFGSKNARRRMGECWKSAASGGVNQIFIAPMLSEPADVLGVLVHELCHAADDCESGHAGAFRVTAVDMGLTGKMTATTVGPELAMLLTEIAKDLGEYPNPAISMAATGTKTQTTRMLKLKCPADGYVVRTTSKWLEELGAPSCPCGETMERD